MIRVIKVLNVFITISVVGMICGLSLVEKQPLVWFAVAMNAILIHGAQRLKLEILADIRSAADEDRPE